MPFKNMSLCHETFQCKCVTDCLADDIIVNHCDTSQVGAVARHDVVALPDAHDVRRHAQCQSGLDARSLRQPDAPAATAPRPVWPVRQQWRAGVLWSVSRVLGPAWLRGAEGGHRTAAGLVRIATAEGLR